MLLQVNEKREATLRSFQIFSHIMDLSGPVVTLHVQIVQEIFIVVVVVVKQQNKVSKDNLDLFFYSRLFRPKRKHNNN